MDAIIEKKPCIKQSRSLTIKLYAIFTQTHPKQNCLQIHLPAKVGVNILVLSRHLAPPATPPARAPSEVMPQWRRYLLCLTSRHHIIIIVSFRLQLH